MNGSISVKHIKENLESILFYEVVEGILFYKAVHDTQGHTHP